MATRCSPEACSLDLGQSTYTLEFALPMRDLHLRRNHEVEASRLTRRSSFLLRLLWHPGAQNVAG